MSNITCLKFWVENAVAQPGAEVWANFSIVNNTAAPIPYETLAARTETGLHLVSWTKDKLNPSQKLDWRDHWNNNNPELPPGRHRMFMSVQNPNGEWERLSDSVQVIVGNNPDPSDVPTDLLINGDFESGLVGWTQYVLRAGGADHNKQPTFNVEDLRNGASHYAVHGGNRSARILGNFCFHAGLLQRVLAPIGMKLKFKAYTRIYANNAPWGDPPVTDSNMNFSSRIGIDPTGGIDPRAATVVWMTLAAKPSDWVSSSISVAPLLPNRILTVFLDSDLGLDVEAWPLGFCMSFWDDARVTWEVNETVPFPPVPPEPPTPPVPPVVPPVGDAAVLTLLRSMDAKLDRLLNGTVIIPPPVTPPPVVPPVIPPSTVPVWYGLHTRTGGRLTEADFAMFTKARIEAVKLLPGGGSETSEYSRLLQMPGMKLVFGRIYIEANRVLSPEQYAVDACDIAAPFYGVGMRYFELMNEPNLTNEGWGVNWGNGAEFSAYWIRVRNILKTRFSGMQIGFPGLSPDGVPYSGRYNDVKFLGEASAAVAISDWVGVHTYWQTAEGLSPAVKRVNDYVTTFAPKTVICTEFSNNVTPWGIKAPQYMQFYAALRGVKAACSFLSSAADSSQWVNEVWLGHPEIINAMAAR